MQTTLGAWFREARLAWVVLAVCATLGILAGGTAWSWVGKRFPGFLIASDWTVSGVALHLTWPGTMAGLRVGDRVVALDGVKLFETPAQYVARLRSESEQLLHRVEVDRPDARYVMLVPAREASLGDMAYALGALLLAGWAALAIAAGTLLRKEQNPATRSTAWASLALGGWAFAQGLEAMAMASPGLLSAAGGALAAGLVAVLLQRAGRRALPAVLAGTWVLGLATVIAVLGELLAALDVADARDWVGLATLPVDLLLVGALVALALASAFQAASPDPAPAHRGSGWIASLLFLALGLAGSAAVLRAGEGYTAVPLGWQILAFLPALAMQAVAAAGRESAGIERLGSRLARGLVLAGAALLAYSLLHALAALALGGRVPALVDGILTAVCVAAAVPGYTRLKRAVDPIFMRTGYDPAQVLTSFARAAREAYDPDLMASIFFDELQEAIKCSAGVVYLSSEGTLAPVVSVGCSAPPEPINGDGPDLSWLVPGQPVDPARYPGAAEDLALPFPARLALSLVGEDPAEPGPLGLVVLGPREGDRPYGAADRDLVSELSRIMARGVQTTRLLSRRAAEDRQRRELEVAWEVQANLLPRELPALEGADLEAYARSAREVGGDFYDVLPVDGNRWGILVGEAIGRGISSAMLAQVTLSFFRSAAPGTPSPAEALRIVNNLVCLYRPSLRASVTVSYAVYDRRDRSLAVSNAGQAYPLLNGYPVSIDGVPLGVGRDAAFAESCLTLKKGDAVLWTTDGVPAARNEGGRQFGAERVLEYARDERLRDAEEPWRLRELLRAHVGDVEQNDDMTYLLLVVR